MKNANDQNFFNFVGGDLDKGGLRQKVIRYLNFYNFKKKILFIININIFFQYLDIYLIICSTINQQVHLPEKINTNINYIQYFSKNQILIKF